MPSTYSNLKIQLMATGENNTTWGDVTNLNLGTALEEAIVGSADVAFSNANVTLTLTDTNASQTARNMRLNLTGTATAGYNLVVPAIEKPYIINNGTDGTITVKNSTGTGIAVPAGKTMWVYNDGTNVVDAVTRLSSLTLGSPLTVGSGGTGVNTLSSNYLLKGNGTSAVAASLVYDNGTNVGIGTNSPSFTFDVQGNSASTPTFVRVRNNDTTSASFAGYGCSTGEGINAEWYSYSSANWFGTKTSHPQLFITNNSERMRITSGGSVGIGTSSPGYSLDVAGTVNTSQSFRYGASYFGTASDYFTSRYLTNMIFNVPTGSGFVWARNGGDSMTLDSGGNLGVGVTPSGWSAIKAVQTGLAASFSGGAAFNDAFIASNGYYDGTNWRYINTNTAYYASVGGSAAARWYTAASGTAGNTISFTQAMTLDASGNLLLNTTTAVQPLTIGSGSATSAGINLRTTQTDFSVVASNSAAGGVTIGTSWVSGGQGPLIFTQAAGERMRLDSSGNLGIGTSSPGYKLDVTGQARATTGFAVSTDGSTFTPSGLNAIPNYGMGFITSTSYTTIAGFGGTSFYTNQAERMRIDGSGNVGIGTSSPSTYNGLLNVKASDRAVIGYFGGTTYATRLGANSSYATLEAVDAATGVSSYQPLQIGGSLVKFDTGGSERMRITAAGDVGIGTSSPFGSSLTNYRNGTARYVLGDGSQASDKKYWDILSSSGTLYMRALADADNNSTSFLTAERGGTGTNWIISAVTLNTAGAERMRVDSSGNVGIGTSSPTQKLEVAGNIRIGSGGDLNISSATGGNDSTLYNDAQDLYFSVNGSTRAYINANGRFMVGTTVAFDDTVGADFMAYATAGSAAAFKVNASTSTQVSFYDSTQTARVGWIGTSGSATSYNTTSDARLKTDVQPVGDVGDKIDAIQIISHKWKNGTDAVIPYAVLAQDLHEIAPHAVTKGDDGEEVKIEWGVDYSKLVPMLIKEMQSLRARVAELEGK